MKFYVNYNLYFKKCFLGIILSMQLGLILGQSEIDLSKNSFTKTKRDTGTVLYLIQQGKLFANENGDSSKLYYEQAYALSKELNYKKGISQYYTNIIFLLRSRLGQNLKALELAKEFEQFAQKENNELYLASANFSLGSTFQQLEKSDSAIIYYEKSMQILEKLKSTSQLPVIYGSLSRLYNEQKMHVIALQYLNKAIELNTQKKDTSSLIINYINKSKLSYDMKDKIEEEKSNSVGLKLAKMSKNKYLQIAIYTNIGAKFEDENQLDSSLYYNKKAYSIAKEYGVPYKAINPLIGIVACYTKLKNYREASKYLKEVDQNPDIDQITLEQESLIIEQKLMVNIGLGKFQEASEMFNYYRLINDSTSTLATKKLLLEFDSKLKNAETEKLFLSKEVKINKQKSWIMGLSFTMLSFLILGVFFYRYQTKNQELNNQKIEFLEQENKFVAVRSALEGQLQERDRISKEIHDDLGSSLTTISLLAEVLKTKINDEHIPEVGKISATSSQMVDSMNEIVWSLNIKNDTLHSLVAFVRKYARDFLQDANIKLTFEEHVLNDYIIKGQVRRNIYLVVKEALNNVVKHADAKKINLKIEVVDNTLHIQINDDGKGISTGNGISAGNGIRNMEQRIEDIGGTFTIAKGIGTRISIDYIIT